MTKAPDTYTAGRASVSEHVHVTYEGTTQIYSPSTASPGASSYTEFSCGHTRHPDYDSAQRCVERRARTYTANRNREAAAAQGKEPCVYAVHEDHAFAGDPMYMRMCTSHHRIDEHLYTSHPAAAASEWVCPWQPLAGVAPVQLPIGTRVEVIEHPYGQYQGDTGTVVPEPPEMGQMREPIDFTGVTWVRLDFQDDRTPAVGFDAKAVLRVLDAAVTA